MVKDFEKSNFQESMAALKRAIGVLNRCKYEGTYPIDGGKNFEEEEEEEEIEVTERKRRMAANDNRICKSKYNYRMN